MPESTHSYDKLDVATQEVRLLRIHRPLHESSEYPGGFQINASLERVRLADVNDKFLAISYTWGPETPAYPIWIEGKSLNIRENIWRFLRHALQTNIVQEHQYLWIDSICINQAVASERNGQVSIMGDIFRAASHILIWLGPASESSSIGTEWVKFCKNRRASVPQLPPAQLGEGDRKELQIERMRLFEACMRQYEAESKEASEQDFERIVYNAYWLRVWIVQEIILARKAYVILGDQVFDFETEMTVFYFLGKAQAITIEQAVGRRDDIEGSRKWALHFLTRIHNPLIKGRERFRHGYPLSELIERFEHQECGISKDKVYGMLGMARTSLPPPVRYESKTEDVFLETCRSFAAEEGANGCVQLSAISALAKGLWGSIETLTRAFNPRQPRGLDHLMKVEFTLPTQISPEIVVNCRNKCPESEQDRHVMLHGGVGHDHTRKTYRRRFLGRDGISSHSVFEGNAFFLGEFRQGLPGPSLLLEADDDRHVKIHGFVNSNVQAVTKGLTKTDSIWPEGTLLTELTNNWEAALNEQIPDWTKVDDILAKKDKKYGQPVMEILLPCTALELLQVVVMNDILIIDHGDRVIQCQGETQEEPRA